MREGLGSPHLDSRRAGTLPARAAARARATRACRRARPTSSSPHAVLVLDTEPVDDAPILDLRLRKGVRRRGMKLAVASPYASSLDPLAACTVRYAPGAGALFARALGAALAGDGGIEELALAAGAEPDAVRALASTLRGAGGTEPARPDGGGEARAPEVVVLWGERLTAGTGRRRARTARCSSSPAPLRLAETRARACSKSRPARTAAACARPACCPTPEPGLASARELRRGTRRARRSPTGSRTASWRPSTCSTADPLDSTCPERDLWERALAQRRHGGRPRRVPHRGPARARGRRLPGRGVRREGGHGRPPRRPPAAPAPRDRAPRRGSRASGR